LTPFAHQADLQAIIDQLLQLILKQHLIVGQSLMNQVAQLEAAEDEVSAVSAAVAVAAATAGLVGDGDDDMQMMMDDEMGDLTDMDGMELPVERPLRHRLTRGSRDLDADDDGVGNADDGLIVTGLGHHDDDLDSERIDDHALHLPLTRFTSASSQFHVQFDLNVQYAPSSFSSPHQHHHSTHSEPSGDQS
jgi:hypothetical protein